MLSIILTDQNVFHTSQDTERRFLHNHRIISVIPPDLHDRSRRFSVCSASAALVYLVSAGVRGASLLSAVVNVLPDGARMLAHSPNGPLVPPVPSRRRETATSRRVNEEKTSRRCFVVTAEFNLLVLFAEMKPP